MDQFNANKPRRLWENREIFTGSAYGVIVVTGPTKTLVPAAVAGLVPRDRGAESELSRGLYKLNKFFTILGNQGAWSLGYGVCLIGTAWIW